MRVIHIHPDAPIKPVEGLPCNGCGVCCLAEPCPVGMLVSWKRTGACRALQWDDTAVRYACGMLVAPLKVLGWRGRGRRSMAIGRVVSRLCARWIAAGIGCDSSLEASGQTSEPEQEPPR